MAERGYGKERMGQSTYGISLGVLNPDGGVGGETRGLCCGVDIVADCGVVWLG